jgi:hypothetical protein
MLCSALSLFQFIEYFAAYVGDADSHTYSDEKGSIVASSQLQLKCVETLPSDQP